MGLPKLSVRQILEWADAFYEKHGTYPNRNSGPVEDTPGEKWSAINAAMEQGSRGLAAGCSLPILLAEERGIPNHMHLADLSVEQILKWADAYYKRHERYPQQNSGPVDEAPEETWNAVSYSLWKGGRGLLGGSSLAKLLASERGKRNKQNLPKLTEAQILEWADSYFEIHKKYPDRNSGPVEDASGEKWSAIHTALQSGGRGLPGGTTLAKLFAPLKK